MKKNTLDAYRKAIKAKYDDEKEDDVTGLLYHPTPAGLKQLCLLLLDNISKEDSEIYKRFFSFKDDGDLHRQIAHFDTDKFRSLRNFLLGGSEKSSQNNLDLLAVLVNLKPRPFIAFLKSEGQVSERTLRTGAGENDNKADADFDDSIIPEFTDNEVEPGTPLDGAKNIADDVKNAIDEKNRLAVISYGQKGKGVVISAKHIKLVLLILLALVFVGYMNKTTFFREEACMQWSGDHYESVICERDLKSFINTGIIHLDKETMALQKKIKACDTTTFFLPNGKPAVWYCKMPDGKVEYFTYPGLHPVTGVTLKHITQHIINKYVLGKDSL